MRKVRADLYLTQGQKEFLLQQAENTGMTMSEILRRAIDRWIALYQDPKKNIIR